MIDINKAKRKFKKMLEEYTEQEKLGFELKVIHTYHVVENAKIIASKLNLSDEDIKLAELIALLHDIGRFEELKELDRFDSVNNDHAERGTDILFAGNYIREFTEDTKYDVIIKKAIYNHNKLNIESGLDDKTLLHAKIIRDADKLDNFRVKNEEKIEAIFPGIIKTKEEMEISKISDKVYEAFLREECVDIHDRKYSLDYWLCVLAFIFDINYKETLEIIKENDYVNKMLDRFKYSDEETKKKIEEIRNIVNNYIDLKIQ